MVPATVFVAGLMTVMIPSRMFPTQTWESSGATATEPGRGPTAIVAVTWPVAVSTTDTASAFMSATYACEPSRESATAYGSAPTLILPVPCPWPH